ncbi:rutC family protein PH0854 [Colletotrichum liriopes]|uniref:RutC family protein PH0854 n=1 Tax=Colletotrichum liriopes TaxID=708192 RepID=A0AA37GZU9_9PEZI|nr:rutC family protein PH0854 [Colletotrichum liriopes]
MTLVTKKAVFTDLAPAPLPFYSQCVVVERMAYVSGSLGIDPATGKFVEGTVADRTTQILTNINNILAATGTSLKNAVKLNVFLTDMSDFETMNEAYGKFFTEGVRPVRYLSYFEENPSY